MIAINLPKALDIESNILGALLLDKRTIPLVIGSPVRVIPRDTPSKRHDLARIRITVRYQHTVRPLNYRSPLIGNQ